MLFLSDLVKYKRGRFSWFIRGIGQPESHRVVMKIGGCRQPENVERLSGNGCLIYAICWLGFQAAFGWAVE